MEAAAALPGLCEWVASTVDFGEVASKFGNEAAEATMLMATRRHHPKLKLARPTVAEMSLSVVLARPAWEHLALSPVVSVNRIGRKSLVNGSKGVMHLSNGLLVTFRRCDGAKRQARVRGGLCFGWSG